MNKNQQNKEKVLGPQIRICDINVEGISRSKAEYLSELCIEKEVDVILIQETHSATVADLKRRGKIAGYRLIAAESHPKYGIATYVRRTITNVAVLESSCHQNIFVATVKANSLTITNVYKPPETEFPTAVMKTYEHPAAYCGDFNSHSTEWGYGQDDANGEKLNMWTTMEDLKLIYDPKSKGTFHSARWNQDYNPDLCFVSCNEDGLPVGVTRQVLEGFPRSQHRPVILEFGVKIPLIDSVPRPRWNFRLANWPVFSKHLDDSIRFIPPDPGNYTHFTKLIISIAKKQIPRGFRGDYIPGWNEESSRLAEEFNETGDQTLADELLKSLDSARRERWIETVGSMSFQQSSRTAWNLLRRLGGAQFDESHRVNPSIHPNKIARRIVRLSKMPKDEKFTRDIIRQYRTLRKSTPQTGEFSRPFTIEEINTVIAQTKTGKAAGLDEIYSEFIVHFGPKTRAWLAKFFTNCMMTNKLPKIFKQAKIIAIKKPGKPPELAESYRPIALLSTVLKLFERLMYNRICDKINEIIPPEQAGFRTGRSCTDQVLALTNFIENGFQLKLKTGLVLVDLTAAYDTIWKKGLLYKFLKVIPDLTLCDLICNTLSDRFFRVHLGDKRSNTFKLNNGLAQGGVMSPLMFNLYISDLPETHARKFEYADDMAFAEQHNSITVLENNLNSDMCSLSSYFKKWRLNPSTSKTESSLFHLDNRLARAKLEVKLNNVTLNFNPTPVYLGVKLDRTLTFKPNLTKLRNKVAARNNIIGKLASSSWGAEARTLRTSALSLTYSAAEYCSPVWINSAHTALVDTQLNNTMRIITGTVKSTPINWLPALANIPPPEIRRKNALIREYRKAINSPNTPLHNDLNQPQRNRLKSRKPPLRTAAQLDKENFMVTEAWKQSWEEKGLTSPFFDFDANRTKEFSLPRKSWCGLNRIRTKHGCCNEKLFKWGFKENEACECGHPKQTIDHMIQDCSLTKFPGPLDDINRLEKTSVQWLRKLKI